MEKQGAGGRFCSRVCRASIWISLKWFLQGEAITNGLVLRFWVGFFAILCFPTIFPQAADLQWWSQTSLWDICELGDLAHTLWNSNCWNTPSSLHICISDHSLQVASFSICPNALSMPSQLSWRSGEQIHGGVWLAIVLACSGFWHLFQKAKLFFLQNLSHYSK